MLRLFAFRWRLLLKVLGGSAIIAALLDWLVDNYAAENRAVDPPIHPPRIAGYDYYYFAPIVVVVVCAAIVAGIVVDFHRRRECAGGCESLVNTVDRRGRHMCGECDFKRRVERSEELTSTKPLLTVPIRGLFSYSSAEMHSRDVRAIGNHN